MESAESRFTPSENFYIESIRNTFQKMPEVQESMRNGLEKKATYLVQLALLNDYEIRKILTVIEG